MSYNHAKLRSLQISQEVQPLSNRNPNSSRVQPISLLSSHILSQGPISTRISNIDDDILSANTTERLRASINSKKGKVIQSSNVADKENLNSDADDLFDNFDRCYRARFITNEKSSAKENKSLPVCRDLSSEFAAGSSSGLSGVKTPLAVGNSGYFQRPKEFQVSKAGRYFDMKTPNSNNNGFVTKLQIGAKNEEDVENEDEEHRQISVKNILTRRSTNYELEQKTLNKIKKGDHRIEIPNQRKVLDDVTNNTERHTHKPTSAHEGVVESNRMSFVEMFTRRGTVGKQTLDKKKNSLGQNGHNETKKLSIPNMLAFLQKRENLQPPTRNSYNGRGCESHRIINHTAKEVEKPATSVSRKDQNKQQSKPKAAVSGRHSARLEHENTGSRGSIKVYESLLRYFEVAKKELSRSNSNVKRSSSGHRRE